MTQHQQQIVILGAGGFAREVAWLVSSCQSQGLQTACFIDQAGSDKIGRELNHIPVKTMAQAQADHPSAKAVCAVGDARLRQKLTGEAAQAGFNFAAVIHPNAQHSQFVTYGAGSIICAGNILTTNITVGNHVHINLDCTIGHDAVIGDFATLAPGVHVSGNVHIGKGAYFGTGAVVINGSEDAILTIGEYATVGAAACVVKDVAPGDTVVGIPAKPLPKR